MMASRNFRWEIQPDRSHQLIHIRGAASTYGTTASYRCPSIIEYDDMIFAIFTEYWTGVIATETVITINKTLKPIKLDVELINNPRVRTKLG